MWNRTALIVLETATRFYRALKREGLHAAALTIRGEYVSRENRRRSGFERRTRLLDTALQPFFIRIAVQCGCTAEKCSNRSPFMIIEIYLAESSFIFLFQTIDFNDRSLGNRFFILIKIFSLLQKYVIFNFEIVINESISAKNYNNMIFINVLHEILIMMCLWHLFAKLLVRNSA